jgi:hypothetical protein
LIKQARVGRLLINAAGGTVINTACAHIDAGEAELLAQGVEFPVNPVAAIAADGHSSQVEGAVAQWLHEERLARQPGS